MSDPDEADAEQKTAPPEEVEAVPRTIVWGAPNDTGRVCRHRHCPAEEHATVLLACVLNQVPPAAVW